MLKTLIIICIVCVLILLLVFAICKPFRDFILSLYKKYKELVTYIIVGVLTTIISFASLYLFHSVLNIRVEVANVIAWILAVLFSFIMNKIVVFESKDKDLKLLLKEFGSFVAARLASLLVDEGILIIGCDVLHMNVYVVKAISEIFVVVINYFFSKYIIFKKK